MTFGPVSRRNVLATMMAGLAAPTLLHAQTGREAEGGIGGTGIVGVLVGFGSLILSGHRVETDSNTVFSSLLGTVAETDITVGDSLTVEAAKTADGRLLARRVMITHPLIGTVTRRSADGRLVVINGVDVLSDQMIPFGPGARVAVSGLWQGTRVIASRVVAASDDVDLVSGTVDRIGLRVSVGGVPVRGAEMRGAINGGFAAAIGRYSTENGYLIAQQTTLSRFTGAAGPLRDLSIEGWLEPSDAAPGVRVAGLGHSFARNRDLSNLGNARFLFQGPYNGRFAVETAQQLPDATAARRRLLIDLAE